MSLGSHGECRPYFFEIEFVDGSRCDDIEGATYPAIEAAIEEAQFGLRELIAAAVKGNSSNAACAIRLVTEHGDVLAKVVVNDVMPANLLRSLGSGH